MWKNDHKTTDWLYFWDKFPEPFRGFGAASASSPSHSWWVLRYTAWLSLTPSLHRGTGPWYQDPPAPERLPPPPPPPHETHLGSVGWFTGGLGIGVFFHKKKRGKKGRKFWGKNGWSKFQGFFWWKETKSFVKNNAWIIHTSCNEDYSKIHVENNFEVEYQLFIDFFTSH